MTKPIPMIALGGPMHGRPIQVDPMRATIVLADDPEPVTWMTDKPADPVAPAPRRWRYTVEELAIFGRRVRVAVLDSLTDDQVNDLAWEVLGSSVIQMIHAKQQEAQS